MQCWERKKAPASYEEIEGLLGSLLRGCWVRRSYLHRGEEKIAKPRVVSLDMETAPFKDTDFLTNERILTIGVARRVSGNFGEGEGVEVRSFLLQGDSDLEEYRLLEELDRTLSREIWSEPLGVVGYGIRDYDMPLLSIKMKRYDPKVEEVRRRLPSIKKLWHIINMLERAIHLDLMNRFRFALGTGEFEQLVEHPKFLKLPLKRIKHPIPPEGRTKGELMYTLWKEKPEKLQLLVEAHAYDILLITEFELLRGA